MRQLAAMQDGVGEPPKGFEILQRRHRLVKRLRLLQRFPMHRNLVGKKLRQLVERPLQVGLVGSAVRLPQHLPGEKHGHQLPFGDDDRGETVRVAGVFPAPSPGVECDRSAVVVAQRGEIAADCLFINFDERRQLARGGECAAQLTVDCPQPPEGGLLALSTGIPRRKLGLRQCCVRASCDPAGRPTLQTRGGQRWSSRDLFLKISGNSGDEFFTVPGMEAGIHRTRNNCFGESVCRRESA